MNTQNTVTPTASNKARGHQQSSNKRSLVPKGITIGLAIFALILSLAGYGFRLIAGDDVGDVLRHAIVLVPAFFIGIPLLFWLGSKIFNKLNGSDIEGWNAISLGCLTSCIAMLWLMGGYS